MKNILGISAFLLSILNLAGCGQVEAPSGEGWTKAGGVDGIPFIVISSDKQTSFATYEEARRVVCKKEQCIQVGFFSESDALPTAYTRGEFFSTGGWSGYTPLAVYMTDGYTKFDCKRAGSPEAPVTALCGNIEPRFDAVHSLALREGWVEGCGMAPDNSKIIFEKFVEKVKREDEKALYRQEFNRSYESAKSGPDEKSFCAGNVARIQREANKAKEFLQKSIKDEM